MSTTNLKLDDPGTLPKPGLVGRVARLVLGLMCAAYVMNLIDVSASLLTADGHIRAFVWNGLLPGLFLVSYVVNIGFSQALGKSPAIVSAIALVMIGGAGYLLHGTVENETLARTIWVWEVYVFSHLGLAFLLAGVLGTPGCEMRAFHDLYSRLTGKPTQEHYCPVGPLNAIDQWEARRSSDQSLP